MVMEKKEKKSIVRVTIEEITSDKSDGKAVSHFKLKAGVINNEEYFADPKYSKTKSFESFVVHMNFLLQQNQTKTQLNDLSVNVIKQCDVMLTPRVFSDVPGEDPTSDTDIY